MQGLAVHDGRMLGGGAPITAIDLSEDELEGFLHKFDLVVVDCWVGWCKHSNRMIPIFDLLAKEMSGKAVFGKVDAQRHYHVPVKYKIRATPTFLIFRRGELVDRLVGEMSKEELAHAVHRQLDFLGRGPAP